MQFQRFYLLTVSLTDFNNFDILYGDKYNDGVALSYRSETADL